jgi:dihydrofolate reductase
MRKVILQMMVTLDGFVAGPNDELDWIDSDPVMGEAHFALAEGADAAVVGHAVYQGMAAYWPQIVANPANNEAEFGKLMSRMSKIVISTTPEKPTWENTEQLLVKDDDDLVTKLTELKAMPGKYLLFYGGVQTAHSFIKHKLVDEYRLDVCPIALGAGKPLFPERTPLRFIGVTPYRSGAMTVTYQAV